MRQRSKLHWSKVVCRPWAIVVYNVEPTLGQRRNAIWVTDRTSTVGSHGRYVLGGNSYSNDLEWSKHIASMTNTANSKLLFLRRNLEGLPREA